MLDKHPVWRCDRCGFAMVERDCKVTCPNCGQRWDCSDLTIWTGDGRPQNVRRTAGRKRGAGDRTAP